MSPDLLINAEEVRLRGQADITAVIGGGVTKSTIRVRRRIETEEEAQELIGALGPTAVQFWREGQGDEHGPYDGQMQCKGGPVMNWSLAFMGETVAQDPCLQARAGAAVRMFTLAAHGGTVTLTLSISLQFGIRGDAENLDAMNGKEVIIAGTAGQMPLPMAAKPE